MTNSRQIVLLLSIVTFFSSIAYISITTESEEALMCAMFVVAILDKVLGSWTILPPAVSWALIGSVVGFLCYFAVFESDGVGKRSSRHWFLVAAALILVLSPYIGSAVHILMGRSSN